MSISTRTRVARAFVLAMALPAIAATGCSAMLSRPPSALPLATAGECSRARAPEIVDAVAGGVAGGVAAILLGAALFDYETSKDDVQSSWNVHRVQPSPGLLVVGGLATASMVGLLTSAKYGHDSARACDAARAELRLRAAPPWQPRP
jgi:ammonia channel protein AmtB